jgi:hypothetical protein
MTMTTPVGAASERSTMTPTRKAALIAGVAYIAPSSSPSIAARFTEMGA